MAFNFLKSKKILVVDDEEDLIQLIETILTIKGGFSNVTLARNGYEALRKVATNKPDLILLDLMLEGIDGWTVAAMIKKNPATAKIPIIALTAHAGYGQDEKLLKKGFAYCINKPFNNSDLLRTVEKYLAGKPL
ncbi:MAG TPA: response regulator [Euryarchaeota archaeon]|nr:response regulator PleD [archaeon BMS3Abin16]GBE55822.1 response regulator PleD [archaeon BMS3Bbin16]HDH27535.1 response regulator [Euryarchaeota archaeon]HDY74714.1 response regulator [Euryarchaeota archaeon]